MIALQCGGSDGYSGITANPALGAAADLLVRHGGTAILSETPEIYGAEYLLTRRSATRAIGEKLIERLRWGEDYVRRHGGEKIGRAHVLTPVTHAQLVCRLRHDKEY